MGSIKFVKGVTFTDCKGDVTKEYKIGDTIEYTAVVGQTGSAYYVTSMVGILETEAAILTH
jgi:hypothetical protein